MGYFSDMDRDNLIWGGEFWSLCDNQYTVLKGAWFSGMHMYSTMFLLEVIDAVLILYRKYVFFSKVSVVCFKSIIFLYW